MEQESERRVHKRLPLEVDVVCQKVGTADSRVYTGRTINVSPGGLLLAMKTRGLRDGELLSVDMSVPSTAGLLEYGGRFSSYARITRIDMPDYDPAERRMTPEQTVALEFCQSPRLRF